jgi:prepilin-type N-terminal cleavage/methylation domain-containing protein
MNRRRLPMARPRGVTLLEVMMVVAIIGVLSGIGGGALRSLITSSKVLATEKVIRATVAGARLRAVSGNCAHFVQINGTGYAGVGAAGFPGRPRQIAVVRKGRCDAPDPFFEPGDTVVDSDWLFDASVRNELVLPAGLYASQTLDTAAFTVGFSLTGARVVAVDASNSGTFATDASLGGAPLLLGVRDHAQSYGGTVNIPLAGTPRLQP